MNRIYPAWDELSDTHGELRELYEAMRTDLAEADAAATLMEAALYEAGEEFARQLAEAKQQVTWQPMETAPLDGTTVLLLIADSEHPLTDNTVSVSLGAYGTKGGPEFDQTWSFAGWDWCQDVFREGGGTPIRWMPQPEVPACLREKEEE